MTGEKILRKETQGQRLNLEIGTRMMVSFPGLDDPLKSVFVGMEPGSYLILRFPVGGVLHDHLYEGNSAVVKYVSYGNVYGFQTQVVGYIFKKNLRLVVFNYPPTIEIYELRKEERIDVYIPAEMADGTNRYHGFILDLSPSGCRFALGEAADEVPDSVMTGRRVNLSVQLLGWEGKHDIVCLVRNVHHEMSMLSLGLGFERIDDRVRTGIKDYVEQVSSFLAKSEI